MKRRQLRNVFFGVNEIYPPKKYDNGLIVLISSSKDKTELGRVSLQETLENEILRNYKPGIKILPAKIIYLIPYLNPADMARFISIDIRNKVIEQNDHIQDIEDIQEKLGKVLENLYPTGVAIDQKTWIEIYTTQTPFLSKHLQYRGKPLMDIVKEIIKYDDASIKRHLDKVSYELVRGIRILK